MNRLLLFIALVFSLSCSKENVDEFATGNSQKGIVGKWKLVRTESSSGGVDVTVRDRTKDNYVISFDSLGNTISPYYKCKGKYIFTSIEDDSKREPNMIITFNCFDKPATSKFLARIEDNNHLYFSNVDCDELCSDVYRRLKD